MSDDDLHELSDLYALDALDDLERQRFERHLASCDTCRAAVDAVNATTAQLADLGAVMPPASMKQSVMEAIRHTPQIGGSVATTLVKPASQRPVPELLERRRHWRPILLSAAAALLLVASMGVALKRSRDDLSSSRALATALADPTATTADYVGTNGELARVVRGKDHVVILLGNLPPVAANRAYAVWLIGADGPHPAGLLRPNPGGSAVTLINRDLSSFTDFGLTEEPAGGSPAPTGPILVSGSI